MTTDAAFIIDIKVTTRVPGESWDVFGQYLGDDQIPLGTIHIDPKASRADRWVAQRIGSPLPSWCPTKQKAVEMLSTELLQHFDSVECRYGKQVWRRSCY